MTLEQKKIDCLYALLNKVEHDRTDTEAAAALRWAIFTLEQVTK